MIINHRYNLPAYLKFVAHILLIIISPTTPIFYFFPTTTTTGEGARQRGASPSRPPSPPPPSSLAASAPPPSTWTHTAPSAAATRGWSARSPPRKHDRIILECSRNTTAAVSVVCRDPRAICGWSIERLQCREGGMLHTLSQSGLPRKRKTACDGITYIGLLLLKTTKYLL